MKLLDNPQLQALSSTLSVETNICKLDCRIESYSCKMAGEFKRSYKHLYDEKNGTSPSDLQLLGPPQTITSPKTTNTSIHSRSLSDDPDIPYPIISRKLLFYLTSTLDASFQPDYDFSSSSSTEFSKEPSIEYVKKEVETALNPFEIFRQMKSCLWESIDNEICLSECDIFTYNPDLNCDDPFSESGVLWFFNYFFFNKKMKRIVYFSCRCISRPLCEEYNRSKFLGPDEYINDEDLMLGQMD